MDARTAPVALIAVDDDGLVTSWNLASEELFGWDESDMLGQPLPDGLVTEVRRLKGIAREGDPAVTGEATIERRGGSTRRLAVALRLVPSKTATMALHDITSIWMAHTELSRDHGSYRALLEHLPVLTYQEVVTGGAYPSGGMIYISPQVKDLLGFTQEEYMNAPEVFWDSVIHPDDRERVEAEAVRCVETGEVFEAEYRVISTDGRLIWLYDTSKLVEVREDGTQLWDGVNIDITERKVVEERLAESEARYRELVEHAPAITYVERVRGMRYPEDVEIFTSPQVRDILGYEPTDWEPGESSFWMTAIHDDDRVRVTAEAARCVRIGRTYRLEYRMIAANGDVVWLRDETRLVRTDPDGAQIWQGVAVDVTDRKLIEEQLRGTIGLLEETDAHRRQLVGDLVKAQELERKRVAATLHDDTVQSLAAVSLRLDLLRRTVGEGPAADEAERVRETVQSAVGRLRALLFDLRPRILDEQGLAPAIDAVARTLLNRSGLPIETHVSLDPEPEADLRTIAFRIAKEAMENADQHAAASKVIVTIAWEPDALAITVEDDGRGFDPDIASQAPGHLGLLTMRERAEVIGGRFDATTVPGEGTTIRAWLPRALSTP